MVRCAIGGGGFVNFEAGSWLGRADTGCGFFDAVGDASKGAIAYG